MDIHQLGVPAITQVVVGSGAGGNVDVPLTPPTGQIYILKAAEVINGDAAPRDIHHYLTDDITGFTMTLQVDTAVAAGGSSRLAVAQLVVGPVICSPGRLRYHATIAAMGAAVNATVNAHIQVLLGVWPIL